MSAEALTVTVPEAAKMLGVSRSQFYQAVKDGDVPPWVVVVRVGRALRIARRPLLDRLGVAT